jgi:hypothetical protein
LRWFGRCGAGDLAHTVCIVSALFDIVVEMKGYAGGALS